MSARISHELLCAYDNMNCHGWSLAENTRFCLRPRNKWEFEDENENENDDEDKVIHALLASYIILPSLRMERVKPSCLRSSAGRQTSRSIGNGASTRPRISTTLSVAEPRKAGKRPGQRPNPARRNLAMQSSWTLVTNVPAIVNFQNVITNAIVGSQCFYRLVWSQ